MGMQDMMGRMTRRTLCVSHLEQIYFSLEGKLTVLFVNSLAGYSFFDSGDVELVGHRKRSPHYNVGE
jgi:hypothetical protein